MAIKACGIVIRCVCGARFRVDFGERVTCTCSAQLEARKLDDGTIQPHATYQQFDTYAEAKRTLHLKHRKPKIDGWFYEDDRQKSALNLDALSL